MTIGIFALVTLSTHVAESWFFLPSSKLGPAENILVSWLKYHVRGEKSVALVLPPDRIDTVELTEVIACLSTAVGKPGPYSTPPFMLMSSLVCNLPLSRENKGNRY